MKSLNNIIENFFSNVGAKPMTLREFIINLLNFETVSKDEKYTNNIIEGLGLKDFSCRGNLTKRAGAYIQHLS